MDRPVTKWAPPMLTAWQATASGQWLYARMSPMPAPSAPRLDPPAPEKKSVRLSAAALRRAAVVRGARR